MEIYPVSNDEFLENCRQVRGNDHVITQPEKMLPYLTDWRGRFTGNAIAALRPADMAEIGSTVKRCTQAH